MEVSELGPSDVPDVVDVLAEAFHDYPVMRFVLDSEAGSYDARLRVLIHFFVMARVYRREPVLGIRGSNGLHAVALVSRSFGPKSPPEVGELRENVWEELGAPARARYEAFGQACADFDPGVPHLHLNMIGVREASQGQGVGGALISAVHALSVDDPTSCGVSLTTEDEGNVALYRHLGYEVIGEGHVHPSLTSWAFYRAD